MSDPRIFIASLVGFFGGLGLFYQGFGWLKQKRMIENIPTSKVRSIAMGMVEVYGSVVPIKAKILKSPLSEKECVYYTYTIEEYRSSGKSSRWVTIKSGSDQSLFFLKDDSGAVLVNPDGATVDIPSDFTYQTRMGKDPPGAVIKFLVANKLSYESFFGLNKTMRFTESYVAPGDKLYIIGEAQDNPHLEDGSAKKNEEDIMIAKGGNFYYISDKPEAEVLRSYGWWVAGGLFGGVALAVGSLIVMLLYLGIW